MGKKIEEGEQIWRAASQVVTPRAHGLTLTCLLAAVTLVTSALTSAVCCTAMIFMGVHDPPRRFTPTCPFLGRILGHLMQHAGLVSRLVRHPDEVEVRLFLLGPNTSRDPLARPRRTQRVALPEFLNAKAEGTQLIMLGNVVAFPLCAFAFAKCWMQTPSMLWPYIPGWTWKWSWTFAIVTQIIMQGLVVDGGMEKTKKPKRKLLRAHSECVSPLRDPALCCH